MQANIRVQPGITKLKFINRKDDDSTHINAGLSQFSGPLRDPKVYNNVQEP